MTLRLPLSAIIALLLPGVFTGCSMARFKAPADRVKIANIEIGSGRSPNFVVFRVTVDYELASRPEGLVGLDLDFSGAGDFRTVTEHHVTKGAGTVHLLAECERFGGGRQRLVVNLAAFPRTLPLALLTSRSRTVSLPR
jgi:hypothetical protein